MPTSPVPYQLVEPCCGSAALSLHLLGATRSLLPYQGSKWRFRQQLVALLERAGLRGPPTRLHLTDPGPWGLVAPVVVEHAGRAALITELEALAARDAREVYDSLHQRAVPAEPAAFAAQFLFLQRLSFSGKAVGVLDGRWNSPGFNTSSAYGLPSTERFGAVRPLVPTLLRVLRSYDRLAATELVGPSHQGAQPPAGPVALPTFVYLDPPYDRVTAYPNGRLDRAQVVQLALAWRQAGASVVISEGEALPELVAQGWLAERLTGDRDDGSRFRGKQQEWVTVSLAEP
jgi:site-specific DNA-adenine methylase